MHLVQVHKLEVLGEVVCLNLIWVVVFENQKTKLN